MIYTSIAFTYDSDIATITLNRPEKRNPLGFQLTEELLAAFDEIEQSSAQVIVLTGAGKAFCAGMDLTELEVTHVVCAAGDGKLQPDKRLKVLKNIVGYSVQTNPFTKCGLTRCPSGART